MNTVNFFNTSSHSRLEYPSSLILAFLMSLLILGNICGRRVYAREFTVMLILALMLPPAMATTPPDNSLLFATNQRVDCGTGSNLKPTTAFTVEAWVKPTTNSQGGYGGAGIIASDSDNDASPMTTGGTYFSVRNGLYGAVATPSGKQELTGNSVPLQWQHVAMVFNGTSLTLYQDGVATASTTFPATTIVPSTNPFFIAGSGLNTGWYNFEGQIDEFRIWNIARTPAQIRQSMNTTLTGSETGLVAYYNFDQTSGTTLPDLKGSNNGTLLNMTGTTEWTAATWNYGYPYVTTDTAVSTTPTTASVSGTLVDGGLSAITASGICYATTANPTISPSCTNSGFPGALTGLTPGATYHTRAYATNLYGTSYGDDVLIAPGNALQFNGTDNFVSTTTQFTDPQGFTLEAWFSTTTTQGGGIIGFANSPTACTSACDRFVWMSNDGHLHFGLWLGGVTSVNSSQSYNDGKWHHVAASLSVAGMMLYADGALVASDTTVTAAQSYSGYWNIGYGNGWGTASSLYFAGKIDEVRIWDVARTQPDIQRNMYHTLAGAETGLVAYYNFDQTSGTTVPDISVYGNTGTIQGTGQTWTAATWNYGYPYVTTGSAISTTPTTASVNGTLVDSGLSAITASGICYATTANPTISPSCTGSFPGLLTGLTPNTTYHARAYATNSYGTNYGENVLIAPGNALQFNGSNYVDAGTGINLANKSFTVEFWARRDATGSNNVMVGLGGASGSTNQNLAIALMGNDKFLFSFYADDLFTPSTYTDNNWHHWACVYDSVVAGTNRWIYRDGVLVASDRSSGNFQGSGNFYIGKNSYGGGYFPGLIDEVRVWNVARTQTEIQSNMYHALAGNETGLVAYYNFDQSGTTLTDLAGGDNNGSLVGSPTWTAATWNYGYPYITTAVAPPTTSVRATTAPVAGTLVDPGVAAVTTSGICYATAATPTTPCSTDGATTAATFTSNLTGLTPGGIEYHARAYATNAYGTNYGTDFSLDVTFVTHHLPVIAQTSPLSVSMSQDGSPIAWAPPTITASDQDNDTLTWSVNTQATHGTATVSGTGASPTTFTYSPNAGYSGSDSFIVQVAVDVDGIATITVNVAIGAAFPMVTSTPLFDQTIKFDTLVGKTQVQTVTFKNTGERALFFNSINTPIAPFSYPKPMPFTFIPWGGVPLTTQTLELSCTPTVAGLKTMTVQIATNDPYNPTLNYPLECLGRQPVVVSSVANNTPLNFGTALINSTLTQTITFSENGNSDLILNAATITGANAADFKITAPTTFPVTIADGAGATASQAITVSCTPTTAIALTATLQITTNDPLNATLTYPLQCAGQYSLTLSTSGQGTIAGCGSSCTQNHSQDAAVTLSATPATGWQLGSWSGDCVNGQVTMTSNKSCTANFTQVITNPTNPGTTTPGGTTTTPGNTTTTPTNTIPTGMGTTGTTTPPPTGSTTGTTTPPTTGTGGTTPTTTTPTGSNSTTTPPSDLTTSVLATVPISNATVDGAMSNYYQTTTNLTVSPNGSVSGGTLAGTVTNQGLIANISIAPNTTVTGGKLSGFNTNSGLLNDVTVSQYSQVQGGSYTGTVVNNGTLNNPLLSANSSVINDGVIENPVILPGANISGGTLVGTIIVLGTFDSVDIPPSATVITQVAAIPPAIFKDITSQMLSLLPPSVISQITPEQFAQIPVKALSGLTSQTMAAISPQVVQSFDAEHIAALNPEEFKAMPSDSVAKLLTNFDAEQITPQEAEKLLPQRWTIDAQGNLTAPPGTVVAVKTLSPANLPAGVHLPNIADLNSSFALGGKGSKPLAKQLNQASTAEGVTVTQQQTGVIHAYVAGAVGNGGRKSRYAFMIDPDHIFILDNNALRGLQINEQGQYIIITEDGKQIPITPMTQDPEGLLKILGKDATIDIRPTGEVLIKHFPVKRTRDGQEVHSVGMFDPFIEPAPEDICTPAGECDWSKADESMQPGLRSGRNARAKAAATITYPDGTSQKLYPAVLSPDVLVEEGKKIAGVEKIIFRMDGAFAVTYQGMKLLLIPEFNTQVQPIPAGKKFKPSLTLQPNGKLVYQVPYLDQLFSTTLVVIEAPAS